VSLLIISRLYFFTFWFLLLSFLLTFQNTIWPFFFGSIPSPNLFLNTLILLSLMAKKPSVMAFILAASIFSINSSLGFGYYLTAFMALYLSMLFIRSQTFFLTEKNLFWIVISSHILVYLSIEIIMVFLEKTSWHFTFFNSILSLSVSAVFFPIQRHIFNRLLYFWRNTKWGEVGHE